MDRSIAGGTAVPRIPANPMKAVQAEICIAVTNFLILNLYNAA
jgi:hypothetical protein